MKVRKDRRRRKKPCTWLDSNPPPPDYKACALLLGYNHGPDTDTLMSDESANFSIEMPFSGVTNVANVIAKVWRLSTTFAPYFSTYPTNDLSLEV